MSYRTDMGLAGVTLAALSPDLGAQRVAGAVGVSQDIGAQRVAGSIAFFDVHIASWEWGRQIVYLTAPQAIAIITLLVLLGRTAVAIGAHAHECARRRQLRARYERRQQRARVRDSVPPPHE